MGTQKVGSWEGRLLQIIMNIKHFNTYFGLSKRWSTLHINNPCPSFKRRQSHKDKNKKCDPGSLEAKKGYKCFNQVAPQGQLWPRVGSLEDSWISPPSDDPDRKQAEPPSLYTCILLKNIARNRGECVLLLCSRPVRRGLMATASRHGSYWHRASKTACKHLHCYELWSWWLMHQSQSVDVVNDWTAGPLLNPDQ